MSTCAAIIFSSCLSHCNSSFCLSCCYSCSYSRVLCSITPKKYFTHRLKICVLFPCFLAKFNHVPLFPYISCSLVPKLFLLCSHCKIYRLFSCTPKPLGDPHSALKNTHGFENLGTAGKKNKYLHILNACRSVHDQYHISRKIKMCKCNE